MTVPIRTSPGSAASTASVPRIFKPQRAVPADSVRPTRAEVNLAHLRSNFYRLQQLAKGRPVWCVLKADGYGHGSKGVARTLERAGAQGVCVALLEEAIELREAGIRIPILVMGGHYGRAMGELVHHHLIPVVHSTSQIEALANEVRYQEADPVPVHVKVDTGMSRLGALAGEIGAIATAIRSRPEVRLHGLMTHLACADSEDEASVYEQLAEFEAARERLAQAGLSPAVLHAANSAAVMRFERAHYDLVRPGIALFGVSPFADGDQTLRPAMRIVSQIIALREIQAGRAVGYGGTWRAGRPSRIATIPMGYADGLSRGLSNSGQVLVRGRKVPIVGIVSMDMTMLDVTDVAEASIGDEVVLLGSQRGPHGESAITAEEVARQLGTIPWEVLTAISRRVPRFYREP